jgi:hypothetical protein
VISKLRSLAIQRNVHREERIETLSPTHSPRRKIILKEDFALRTQRVSGNPTSGGLSFRIKRSPSEPDTTNPGQKQDQYKRSLGNVQEILERKRRDIEENISETSLKLSAILNQSQVPKNQSLLGPQYFYRSQIFGPKPHNRRQQTVTTADHSFLTVLEGVNNKNVDNPGCKQDLISRMAEMGVNQPAKKPKKSRANSSINITNNNFHEVSTLITEFENKSNQSIATDNSSIYMKTERESQIKHPRQRRLLIGNFFGAKANQTLFESKDEISKEREKNQSEAITQEWKKLKSEVFKVAAETYMKEKKPGLKRRNRVETYLNNKEGEGHISSRMNTNIDQDSSEFLLTEVNLNRQTRKVNQRKGEDKDFSQKISNSKRETRSKIRIKLSSLGRKDPSLEARISSQVEQVLLTARSRVRTEVSEDSVLKAEKKPRVRDYRLGKNAKQASSETDI